MQFPKELQPGLLGGATGHPEGLNEVQFPKELQQSAQYSPPTGPSEGTSRALQPIAQAQPRPPSALFTALPSFQRFVVASAAQGSSSTGALASGDKWSLRRDGPGQTDVGESLLIDRRQQADVAQEHGVLVRLDDSFQLTPHPQELGRRRVYDEHGVLNAVPVLQQRLRHPRPAPVGRDIVGHENASDIVTHQRTVTPL